MGIQNEKRKYQPLEGLCLPTSLIFTCKRTDDDVKMNIQTESEERTERKKKKQRNRNQRDKQRRIYKN